VRGNLYHISLTGLGVLDVDVRCMLSSCMHANVSSTYSYYRRHLKHETFVELGIARSLAELWLYLSTSVRQQTNSIHSIIHEPLRPRHKSQQVVTWWQHHKHRRVYIIIVIIIIAIIIILQCICE